MTAPAPLDALVVGAGIGGLYQLHRLLGQTLRVRAVESGDGVGGTWYWNRYPGARCDVQSIWYSYSFSPELEQEWTWTERYPAQAEVLAYLNHVADRFNLRRHITFGTRVTAASYDEARHLWRVSTDTTEHIEARFVVMAVGCLSNVPLPAIPGIDRFEGERYQTSRWPHDGVALAGKRVGIIGTGSSGVQAIPELARQAAQLTVFQRTPSFSLPAGNRRLEPDEVRAVKADYPGIRARMRRSGAGMPLDPPTRSAFDVSDEERTAIYEDSWNSGQPARLGGSFTDYMTDRAANETAAEFVRSKIRQIVTDPEVAAALCPTTYPIGSKRLCIDNGYYATYNRDNVTLVDLRRTPIVEITEHGVRTEAAEFELDVLVLATGFDAITGALAAIDIRGRGARSLADEWSEGPKSYLGLAVAGFPNLFTVTGPLSPSVLSNMVVSIEQHVEWISDCIGSLQARGLTEIEATAQAQERWGAHAADVGSRTLFPAADSWYMGANIPGKTRTFMCYVGGVGSYRQRCEEIAANDYEGFLTAR